MVSDVERRLLLTYQNVLYNVLCKKDQRACGVSSRKRGRDVGRHPRGYARAKDSIFRFSGYSGEKESRVVVR